MSPRLARIVRNSLTKKGFIQIADSDHQVFQLHVNGKKVSVNTFYSHGARECDDYILGRMAKQLRLSRALLDALIDCPLSTEAYIEVLIPSCVQMNATWYKAAGTDARKFLKQLGFPVFQKLWRTAFNAN